jgi:ATP-dependent Clp protease ATP-binding subunit ClpC
MSESLSPRGDLMERFTQRARMAVYAGCLEAKRSCAPGLGTEHLLMGLIIEERSTGIVADTLKHFSLESVRAGMRQGRSKARIERVMGAPISTEALNVLEFAIEESRSLHHRHATSEHLLLGLLREPNGPAARMLSDAGMDAGKSYLELREFLVGARTTVIDANVVRLGQTAGSC